MSREQNETARTCDTCLYHLGGGDCRLSEESECREGGGYELWAAGTAVALLDGVVVEV